MLLHTSHLLVNLGISKFEIFEFSTSGYEISKEINKGVLGRPWTKRMVLRAIFSTLKFQFAEHHENERSDHSVRQKIGDPGPHKVAHQFSAHFCLVKTFSIATWGQRIKCFMNFKNDFVGRDKMESKSETCSTLAEK